MNARSVGRIIAVLASVALVSGCSATPSGSTEESSAAVEPVSGGDVTYAIDSDPGNLDPHQVRTTVAYAKIYVDSLTDQDPETGEVVPYLAEKWSVNDDATEYTFTIRQGVTFSDGSALTAANVKENFDEIIELGAVATLAGGYLDGYIGTEVIDDYTAVVRFEKSNAPFLQGTSTGSLGIIGSASFEKTPEERAQGAVIGSGPFTLAEYVPGSKIRYEKRDDYNWPSELAGREGAAYLDSLTFTIVSEGTVRVGGLGSGEFDGIAGVPWNRFDEVSAAYEVLAKPNPGNVRGLQANTDSPYIADDVIRHALQKGIDRTELRDTLTNSSNELPKSALAPGTPGEGDDSEALAYDPEGAEALLEEDGWVLGDDGIREKNGQKLQILVILTAANTTDLELVQAQLKQIGVDVKLEVLASSAEHFQRRAEAGWDFTVTNLTRGDGDTLWNDFRSGHTPPQSAAHIKVGSQPELDELLDAQRAAADVDERNALLKKAQTIIINEGLLLPLYAAYETQALGPHLHGVTLDASRRAFVWYNAWLDEA